MLISVHIPKSGGQTFGKYLGEVFGGDHVLFDYTDGKLVTQQDFERKIPISPHIKDRMKSLLFRVPFGITLYKMYHDVKTPPVKNIEQSDIKCIHGHFLAKRYKTQFPDADIITWFREPVQRLVSLYEYWNRMPAHEPPEWFRRQRPDFSEFAFSPHIKDEMTRYMDGVTVDSLSFAGITEDFHGSINIFNRYLKEKCGTLSFPENTGHRNANPKRPIDGYSIDPDLALRIRKFHEQDCDLYGDALRRHTNEIEQVQTAGMLRQIER